MNQKSASRSGIYKDQTKIQKLPQNSTKHGSISLQSNINEFINRQKLYDDIYNNNYIKNQSLTLQTSEKTIKNNKYKDVVSMAKLKYTSSPNNMRDNKVQLQQNSIIDIVEYLRNQRKMNNIKLKVNSNNIKKIKQFNLNVILVIAIPLICFLVVFIEMYQ